MFSTDLSLTAMSFIYSHSSSFNRFRPIISLVDELDNFGLNFFLFLGY